MKRIVALLGLLGLIGGAVAVYLVSPEPPAPPAPKAEPPKVEPPASRTFALPSFSETRFLNTGPDARYVGSTACATCHQDNHKSYLLTAHSHALSDLDPAAEPPDAAFEHKLSGRSYRVYRKDGQLRHEETVRTAEGKEMGRVDLPIRYLIGSGNFCRSYLVEVDGFLHESPLTWYTAKKKWDMSPGYDAPGHWSFERPIRAGCVACHAGRAEPTDGAVHRMTFHEKSIGCETCHGPGSLHQDLHRSRKLAPNERDFTIVNPGKLSRPLQESVCAACHLSSLASVDVRGRQVTDSRPGRPLSDFRVHYTSESERDEMTVVGHVEQLRLSRCYQKTADLTCVTCHDPHAKAKPADPTAFYRQKCLDCHTTKPCGLPPERRLKQNPADNCAACHMPRGDTEIPHLAFTHHRIGKHTPRATADADTRVPNLVPLDENPHLDAIDRQRNLGLAYMEAYGNPRYAKHAYAFQTRAVEHLGAVYAAGLRDGEAVYSLAELAWAARDLARARTCAREAIGMPDLRPETKTKCLAILANCDSASGDFRSAVTWLEQSVRLRRFADDWRMIGGNYLDNNQPGKAIPAFEHSLSIRPYRHTTHLGLAECFRLTGDLPRANDHLQKAEWLRRNKQD